MNYKLEKTYWLVNSTDYTKLVSASDYSFDEEHVAYFEKYYGDKLLFSYDNHFWVGHVDHQYYKDYKFMGVFPNFDRKKKLEKIAKSEL